MICGCTCAASPESVNNQQKTERAGNVLPACFQCGRPLEADEIAMTKKMVNRGEDRFLCLSCLACRFDVPEENLRRKILEFREMGCTLFP